jgi:phosphoribosylformimino-5-aminoimidazole carboxamide ribotide isomerase
MRIIPAIDIIEGKAVRLEKGDFDRKKVYADDPVEVAKSFEEAGLKYLHLVDLDGAKVGRVQNQDLLERIKSSTNLIVDYGGGIRTKDDVYLLKNAGADQVNIGSLSIKDLDLTDDIISTFGPEFIILSPDVINGRIAINGWQDESDIDIMDYLAVYVEKGIEYFVCTDISRDGMLSGSSIELYTRILEGQKDIKLIASGGVAEIDELDRLNEIGINGVIIGKAIYEGRISLKELERYVV